MKIVATQIRNGTTILHEGAPWKILSFEHRTPGKGNALISVKMRNVVTGAGAEQRFRPDEQVERAELEEREMEFIYEEGDSLVFMNTENYEQMPIGKDFLGDSTSLILPNMRVMVQFFSGKPIGVTLPKLVALKVTDTEPNLKGATAARQTKPATLDTGLRVQVPAFIQVGDVINVDSETLEYSSRAGK